jgi:hypothetical protein
MAASEGRRERMPLTFQAGADVMYSALLSMLKKDKDLRCYYLAPLGHLKEMDFLHGVVPSWWPAAKLKYYRQGEGRRWVVIVKCDTVGRFLSLHHVASSARQNVMVTPDSPAIIRVIGALKVNRHSCHAASSNQLLYAQLAWNGKPRPAELDSPALSSCKLSTVSSLMCLT